MLGIYGLWATNTWIYYTNTSPLSTIIWLNFATKLCQPLSAPKGQFNDEDTKAQNIVKTSVKNSCLGALVVSSFRVGGRRMISRSVRLVRMDPDGQRGKKSHLPSPSRGSGRYFAPLHQP